MKLHRKFHRCLNLIVLVALLLLSSPAPSLARREVLRPPPTAARPDRAQAAASSSTPVFADLRDHGLNPPTVVAFVGQPVVWTNRGTKVHTVTEGAPIFRLYLPLVLREVSASAVSSRSITTLAPAYTPRFDSGPLAPGAPFTHTFAITGTFTYYSAYAPGDVVGTISVIQPGEQVSETVSVEAGGAVTTTNGAQVAIAPRGIYTDTDLSVTVLPNLPVTSTWGTSVGPAYDIKVGHADAISAPITITLPYDPATLPDGAQQGDLRAAYFNGLSWIMVPAQVHADMNTVVMTTTHLSNWWLLYPKCKVIRNEDVFTEDEKMYYEAGRDYLARIAAHKDLIEAFRASSAPETPLITVNHEGAEWLGKGDLCTLVRTPVEEINATLGLTVTEWTEVAEAVIYVGEALNSEVYDALKIKKMIHHLHEAKGYASKGLEVLEWVEKGITLGSIKVMIAEEIAEFVVFKAIAPVIWRVGYELNTALYYNDMKHDIKRWLIGADEVGSAGLERHVNRLETDNGCWYRYGDYNDSIYGWVGDRGFYKASMPAHGDEVAEAFLNLYYKESGAGVPGLPGFRHTAFVIGLQEIRDFWEYYLPVLPVPDRVEGIFVLLEYTDAEGNTQVSSMWMRHSMLTCAAGIADLPDIVEGSEVKVTYYFIQKNLSGSYYLDPNFGDNGVGSPIPAGERLCYGYCSDPGPNQPPYRPSEPTPADGATGQSLDVDLSWTGGDPDGDGVTYDVYFGSGTVLLPLSGCSGISTTFCDPGTLEDNTQYSWQVVAEDVEGATISGPTWVFTTTGGTICPITLTLQSPQITDLTATVSGTVTSDCSTITRLNWQWGDGASDDQGFPASHTYAISGTYPITVTAYNDLGDTEVANTTAYVGTAAGEMVLVPAGEFQMGCDDSNPSEDCYSDEQPLHTVYLDAYTIDKYEVTNAQYAEFLNVMGNQEEGGDTWLDADDSDVRIHESGGVWQVDTGYETHPVVEVTWYGARAYCQWRGKRLPTEAEWEKAARGSSDTRMYPWGNEDADCSRLNYNYCVGDTTPVGSYPTGASPYGAMDMAGNVWEWVNDWYDSDYYSTSPYENPPGPASGTRRVLRGGSWSDDWTLRARSLPLQQLRVLQLQRSRVSVCGGWCSRILSF